MSTNVHRHVNSENKKNSLKMKRIIVVCEANRVYQLGAL